MDRPGVSRSTLVVVVSAAVGLRYAVALVGSNFDLESYRIVADLVLDGENVYASTDRYNYGPIWFGVLGAFEWVARVFATPELFRFQIITLLTAADLAIAAMVLRRWGPTPAAFFVLSPVSIIITGFHNQFDNLAILAGLGGVLLLDHEGDTRGRFTGRGRVGLGLLALSLVVKHLLVFVPVWLAARQATWRRRVVVMAVPWGVFGLSLLPWVAGGREGIVDNVLTYRSNANAPLLVLLTGELPPEMLASAVFVAAMLVGAVATRTLRLPEMLLVHLAVLVVFAPAIANQYLAIPLIGLVVWRTPWLWVWTCATTAFLVVDIDGFAVESLREKIPHRLYSDGLTDVARYRLVFLSLVVACVAMLASRGSLDRGGLSGGRRSHRRASPPVPPRESSRERSASR